MKNKRTKQQIGKANRAAGLRFEAKVRKDLESKGWICSKWSNTVEFNFKVPNPKEYPNANFHVDKKDKLTLKEAKLIPAKRKYNPFKKVLAIGTGFPDFIAFRIVEQVYNEEEVKISGPKKVYGIIGVEVKSNGYLKLEEREKCKWLLENNIFSKILIASKGEKRGEIEYVDFR